MDFALSLLQMQLDELANCIFNMTGSAFSEETLCKAIHPLGITRTRYVHYAFDHCIMWLLYNTWKLR